MIIITIGAIYLAYLTFLFFVQHSLIFPPQLRLGQPGCGA